MKRVTREGAGVVGTRPVTASLGDIARAVGARREPEEAFPAQLVPSGVSIDTRTIRPGELYWVIRGDRLDGHDFVADAFRRGAAGAVVERPVTSASPTRPLLVVRDTLEALTSYARAVRDASSATVVAVTGSNGKTTTRSMLERALGPAGRVVATMGNLNNHIGLPLSVVRLSPEHRVAVFELGMNHLGEIHALSMLVRPHVALITNVGNAHVGPVGGLENVRRAKLEILDGLEAGGVLLLPAGDPALVRAATRPGVRVETVGETPDATHRIDAILAMEDGRTRLSMAGGTGVCLAGPGRPVAMAGAFALAAARVLGVPLSEAAERLAGWAPVRGRMSVHAARGVTVLDDSYNANPDSMAAALDTLRGIPGSGRRIALLGDMAELGAASGEAHERLVRAAATLDGLGLVGEASAAAAAATGTPADALPDAEAALAWLHRVARAGDVVLIKASRRIGLDHVVDAFTERKGPS